MNSLAKLRDPADRHLRYAGPTVALGLALLTVTTSLGAADPMLISAFMKLKPKWASHVDSQYTLAGRLTTFSETDLRFKGCDLKFVLSKPFERPRSSPYATVTGRLVLEGQELRFLVTSVEDWKSELQQITERLRDSDRSDPRVFNELADWADVQAEFYDDALLRERAQSLRTQGISAAQKKASLDRPTEFLALADKVLELGLAAELRQELLHDATRAELLVESRSPSPRYSIVLNHIRERFPKSAEPLAELPQQLWEQYTANPRLVYAEADAELRPTLDRLLYVDAVTRQARAELKPDGSNGTQVAATLERLAPEQAALAADYRERELTFREAQAINLPRAEVLEFRQKLADLGQPERGRAVVEAWIRHRFEGRPRGPETSIDQAEHIYDMLNDQSAAIELVTAAMRVDPQIDGGARLLARMGMGWHNGMALPLDQIPARPPDPIVRAIEEGRVIAGMTDAQVRAALGGEPAVITRLSSQSLVTELWHFPEENFTVHFQAPRRDPHLKVVRIVATRRADADESAERPSNSPASTP